MITGFAAVESTPGAGAAICAGVGARRDGYALEPSVAPSGMRGCTAASFACCSAGGVRAASRLSRTRPATMKRPKAQATMSALTLVGIDTTHPPPTTSLILSGGCGISMPTCKEALAVKWLYGRQTGFPPSGRPWLASMGKLDVPSYGGNSMLKSLGNVLLSPKIGLMLIDFEQLRRLRVNNSRPSTRAARLSTRSTPRGWSWAPAPGHEPAVAHGADGCV